MDDSNRGEKPTLVTDRRARRAKSAQGYVALMGPNLCCRDSGQQGRTVSLHGADSLKADLSEDRITKCEDSSVLKYLEYANDRPGHHAGCVESGRSGREPDTPIDP
jgi:hypothetical protein